jgi:hypothetical protein
MAFRPHPHHRQNRQRLMELTAAVHNVFGNREQDQARPLGAFYPEHVSARAWLHIGGIWYRALDEQKVRNRTVNAEVVEMFSNSILTGQDVELPSGVVVTWERIPAADAAGLPPPLRPL